MVVSGSILTAVLSSVFATQTVTAAVTSMSKPKKEDGFYAFFYRFLHSEVSVLQNYLAHKDETVRPKE